MHRLSLLLACLLLAAPLAASQVDELVKEAADGVDPEEFEDPDSRVFADRLAALVKDAGDLGLSAAEQVDLKIHLLEALLGSCLGAEAEKLALAILEDKAADAERQHRIGLGLVAAWQLLVEDEEIAKEMPDPVKRLDEHGAFGPLVRGRAFAVLGQSLSIKQDEGYRGAFEQGIKILADQPHAERVPVYSQYIAALERAKVKPKEIEALLLDRKDDPAVAEILENLLTGSQKLVGRQAPAMAASRLDGKEGKVAVADFKGKPLLIYFFASWCKPCEVITPLVVKLQGTELAILGVSFDNRDTIANLPGYLAKSAVAFPVIGEQLGWDSEMDETYHVDAIPHLVLVDSKGVVIDADMIGADGVETARRIAAALAKLVKAEGKPPEPPEEDLVP